MTTKYTRSSPVVTKLAAEAECDPRTVLAILQGRRVRGLIRTRIERAAKKLKVELPKQVAKSSTRS